jgi:hypothetical protein
MLDNRVQPVVMSARHATIIRCRPPVLDQRATRRIIGKWTRNFRCNAATRPCARQSVHNAAPSNELRTVLSIGTKLAQPPTTRTFRNIRGGAAASGR